MASSQKKTVVKYPRCSSCNQRKPLSSYYGGEGSDYPRSSRCKLCTRNHASNRYWTSKKPKYSRSKAFAA